MDLIDTYDNGYAPTRERFDRDTAEHELHVLRDDGLYRHLRCMRPKSYMYGFDVVTWPGYLALVGDIGDYVFTRVRDMFDFFGSESSALHPAQINPHYWAQKLRAAPREGTPDHRGEVYSAEAYEARVRAWVAETQDDMEPEKREAFAAAVERDLIDTWEFPHSQDAAVTLLDDFEHDGIRIREPWEWRLAALDSHFVWACFGIVWAIGEYRKLNPSPDERERR